MTVESASYISQLNPDAPDGDQDPKSGGDNHLRLIKTVLQTQFPNLGTTAVSASSTELNLLDGQTVIGTAANLDVGTSAGDVVQVVNVDGSPGLPTLDGSQLTNIHTTDTLVSEIEIVDTADGLYMMFFMGQL